MNIWWTESVNVINTTHPVHWNCLHVPAISSHHHLELCPNIKNHCYDKATWWPRLHKCQHWEAVGKCLFSDGFFPSPRFPFLCFPFLSQPFPFPAPLVQPPISRSRILPPPLVHVHHHHHHAPFSLFYSSTSHPLWSQHSVAGILQSMFWKCCSDPSIVMLKHLPLRRSCFHSQHSHRTERVGSVRCRGNIGSSGPHKDQPSRSWVGLLLRVAIV